MGFTDFIVAYDPKTDTIEDISRRILYSLFIRRRKLNFPTVVFVGGDSGEGKSYSILKLLEELLAMEGHKLIDYVNDINVYVPTEYPQKVKNLINEKRLKKINYVAMHEARDIIKAKNWSHFLSMAVADINAQVRSVKRLTVFICSQFIRDITKDTRYSLNYYITVKRKKGGNRRVQARISTMWKDDRDLESPKLRKRRVTGFLKYPDGRYRRITPQFLELGKPSKEIYTVFEKCDLEAKREIINKKLDKLIQQMKLELEEGNAKVNAMVTFYSTNTDSLLMIGKKLRKKWKVRKEVADMHGLTPAEVKDFEAKLNVKLKSMRIIEDDVEL